MACRLKDMRLWRNWQTRTFEGRVGNRMGSSPINRTKQGLEPNRVPSLSLFLSNAHATKPASFLVPGDRKSPEPIRAPGSLFYLS